MVASTPARRPSRLDALTGLRFWFAFLVVVHHSLQHWFGDRVYPVADFGYIGVDFFFVLSGFVLTWSWRPEVAAAQVLVEPRRADLATAPDDAGACRRLRR